MEDVGVACWESGAARATAQVLAPGGEAAVLHTALFSPAGATVSPHTRHLGDAVDPRLHVRWIADDEDNPAAGSYGLFARAAPDFAEAVGERERDGSRNWHGDADDKNGCSDNDSDGASTEAGATLPHVFPLYGTIKRSGVRALLADLARVLGSSLGEDDVFFDLGSGVGNVVRQVSKAPDGAGRCVGIEFDAQRHARALVRAAALNDKQAAGAAPSTAQREMLFLCEDFSHSDLRSATVIFTNSIAFGRATLLLLADKAAAAPVLRAFVSTRKLPPGAAALQCLILVLARSVQASWGKTQYYIYVTAQEAARLGCSDAGSSKAEVVIPAGSVLGEYVGEVRSGTNRRLQTRLTYATEHVIQPSAAGRARVPAAAAVGVGQRERPLLHATPMMPADTGASAAAAAAAAAANEVFASRSTSNTADDQYALLLENTLDDDWQARAAAVAVVPAESEEHAALAATLYIDSRLHRNEMAFANDPLGPDRSLGGGGRRCANAEAVEVMVGGWPHMLLVSTLPILPGDEVLLDYGEDYWASQARTRKLRADVGKCDERGAPRCDDVGFWDAMYADVHCRGGWGQEWLEPPNIVMQLLHTKVPCVRAQLNDEGGGFDSRRLRIVCLGCGDGVQLMEELATLNTAPSNGSSGAEAGATAASAQQSRPGPHVLGLDFSSVALACARVALEGRISDAREGEFEDDVRVATMDVKLRVMDTRALGWRCPSTLARGGDGWWGIADPSGDDASSSGSSSDGDFEWAGGASGEAEESSSNSNLSSSSSSSSSSNVGDSNDADDDDAGESGPTQWYSYDIVVDKGLLDCVCCAMLAIDELTLQLLGVARLLRPGGSYVLLSSRGPEVLMRHLSDDDRLGWRVVHSRTPQGAHAYVCTKATSGDEAPQGGDAMAAADEAIVCGLAWAARRRSVRASYVLEAGDGEAEDEHGTFRGAPEHTALAPLLAPPQLEQLRVAGPNTARAIYGGELAWGLLSYGLDEPLEGEEDDVDDVAEWGCDVCAAQFGNGGDGEKGGAGAEWRDAPRVRCAKCADFDICARCFAERFESDCRHAHHGEGDWVVFHGEA